ncbi:aquaporin-11 [Ctenocephalides felis]|uniref:aquaporin-11 n=1 Tax=Ctenocephalides felis TaxID=7515 RepID=UPI000E6E4FA6|nr:aquaporin-11 [Ctenocephalides felis]
MSETSEGVHPLVWSAGFIAFTLLLAQVCRMAASRTQRGMIRSLILEGIAAAELCASCFELIIVADNYGVSMYAIFLFVLTIWWSMVWGDATACPYTLLEDVVEDKATLREAVLKTWAQLVGGCLIFRYVQLFWYLELSPTHTGRAFENCTADLQVSPMLGTAIEGIATCLCRLTSKVISHHEPRFAAALDSFVGTALVVAAFNYSGGYFNPVLATSLKFGCMGHSAWEHVIVYWFGACAGALAAVALWRIPQIRNRLIGSKLKSA